MRVDQKDVMITIITRQYNCKERASLKKEHLENKLNIK